MAADTTRLIIELQTILRGLNQTLRGLDQVKKKLDSLGSIGTTQKSSAGAKGQIADLDRLAKAKQKIDDTDRKARESQQRFEKNAVAESKRNAAAVESLQRQRSAALIKQFNDQERAQERARKSVSTLDQSLSRVGGSLRNLGQGLTSLGSSLSLALTAPLTALGVVATQNAVTLDSLKRGLEAITGSADEAGVQLQRLTKIAKLPGIGFQEAIQGSIRLQAVGFSAEQAERALVQFSNAVALTGGGRDELNRITVQLGQLSAKGKVLSQDLKPIIEAGPAVGRALKEAFGTVNAEDIQALGLTSEEFLDRLVKQLEQLPRAAGGARNTLENFSDALFRASAAIGDAILPILTSLINIAEPVITALANGFKSLSPVLQVLIVGFGGLVAAIGPALFIFGQFVGGIGGLLSAFARLHALGLLPTIKGFQLLGQVMRGTAGLAAGQAATTAAAAAGWIAVGAGVIIAVGALLLATGAIKAYVDEQKKSNKVSIDQIKGTNDQVNSLKSQIAFVESLGGKVKRTAEEESRLAEIYGRLNTQAKIRVTGITDEEKRLEALRKELERLLALRREEQGQQAANLAANLANTAAQLRANEQAREGISTQIQVNTRLAQSIQATGKINTDQARQLAATLGPLGQNIGDVDTATRALNLRNETLIEQQSTLIDSAKELTTKANEQGAALAALEKNGAGTARQFLSLAKQIGLFQGNIEDALGSMNRFLAAQEAGTPIIDAFTKALQDQNKELLKAGDAADALRKARKGAIDAAVSLAQEASSSLQGALADLNAFIAAQPELRAAFEKEAQLAGKSFQEFVQDALGGKARGKIGTSLRSAQQELAKALADVALASSEEQIRVEKQKNDQLIQAAEVGQKLQLISYREFLELRASLTSESVRREIVQQGAIVAAAKKTQASLLAAASVAGIPAAERVKRQAEAAKANEEAIKAEAKLNELVAQRDQVEVELQQTLKLARKQQIDDVRQLDIEFAELQGHVEDALKAQTADRLKEQLRDLSLTQERLNKQLEEAKRIKDADRVAQLESAQRLNQSQIDVIELLTQQQDALAGLAAANELVRQAKEKQQQLEEDLTFQIQFRGLKEEEAIKQRLAGEEELNNSLTLAHETIRQIVEASRARGVEPPRALLDFLKEIQGAVKGLGELSLSEQFQLAQKEFERLNDERLRKIADIERAVRERDIAEAEGLLFIRRINGQYSADLEQQLALLKQIAAQSNDANLIRQAQSAEETVKDANSQLADFDRQLRSASIDALREGFTNFFTSLTDRTKTAKEKLLDLVNSVAARIEQVIAENLSQRLIESLFGDGTEGGGLLASLGRLLGIGDSGKGVAEGITAASGVGQTAQATATATVLTAGVTAASTTFVAGVTTAGTGFSASVLTAATSFAATILSAAAAFAATIAGSSAAQTVSQSLGGLGGAIAAATGIFPAVEGGAVHIVEGGFPEAVLTTDPRHAARQLQILKAFLHETHGLGGRIRGLAMGGFTDRIDISAPNVSLANTGIGDLAVAAAPSTMRLRQVLVDQRDWRNEVNSPEGEQVLVDFLYKKQHVIRKLSSGK